MDVKSIKTNINLIDLQSFSIWEQLQIEEALLRNSDENWCIINTGSCDSIVMGISGKVDKLLNVPLVSESKIPVIKRFSGGGTVVVDNNTLFVTFIFNEQSIPIPPFPQPIMKWTESFYRPIFNQPDFHLRENDYVLGEKKFGGNAQYIQKKRWLHHTSFLWDYDEQKMNYLLLPEKRPAYRQDRSHSDFLCRLKHYFPSKHTFFDLFKKQLHEQFHVKHSEIDQIDLKAFNHRQSTTLIQL